MVVTQIEKLNEKNYRSWATTIRATLRKKELFDVVEGKVKAPPKPAEGALANENNAYDTALKQYKPITVVLRRFSHIIVLVVAIYIHLGFPAIECT